MVLRQRLMEQMESRMQVEDEELRDLIDMAILEAAEGAYLPLKERLCLRKELFDSFRRLDILQELVDDPTITEIMVNGTEHIFVERQGRVEELEKHFDSVGQLEDLIQQIVSRVNRTVNLACLEIYMTLIHRSKGQTIFTVCICITAISWDTCRKARTINPQVRISKKRYGNLMKLQRK